MTHIKKSENFEALLLGAVDYGLAVFGEGITQAIYSHFERKYNLKREDIPMQIESFHKALQLLLGTGIKVIEKLIAKKFYNDAGLNFIEHENWTLVEYIKEANKF